MLLSQTGQSFMQPEKLMLLSKLALWYRVFPLDRLRVYEYFDDEVRAKDLLPLGAYLDLHPGVLGAIEDNTSGDLERRKREVVKKWMSSTHTPPCWWHLVQALKERKIISLVHRIEKDHGEFNPHRTPPVVHIRTL